MVVVANQGQEIYGDGRRIDELDQYIMDGQARNYRLVSQHQLAKDGYDHQLKAEADKFAIARQQLADKSVQVEQGQAQLNLVYDQATQELSAARQKHSIDASKIAELKSQLDTTKFEYDALQRFNQTTGDERHAYLTVTCCG